MKEKNFKKENFPIDPIVYDKATWPKLSIEEKRDAAISFAGQMMRIYQEIIEEKVGKDKAMEIGSEVWVRMFKEGQKPAEASLGIKGMKNAIPFIKWSAYLEEELQGCTATTVEASSDVATRVNVKCKLGDELRRQDCECMAIAAKRYVEENYPGYSFSWDSVYHDTGVCIYRMYKIK